MTKCLFLWLPLVALLFACNSDRTMLTRDQLVKKWDMAAVIQNGQDVSEQHNPSGNRWIELTADGNFVSDGDPYGRNTGTWTFDTETAELFLDSDAGEGDDSYWIVSENGEKLILKGARSEFTREFSMVWK